MKPEIFLHLGIVWLPGYGQLEIQLFFTFFYAGYHSNPDITSPFCKMNYIILKHEEWAFIWYIVARVLNI